MCRYDIDNRRRGTSEILAGARVLTLRGPDEFLPALCLAQPGHHLLLQLLERFHLL